MLLGILLVAGCGKDYEEPSRAANNDLSQRPVAPIGVPYWDAVEGMVEGDERYMRDDMQPGQWVFVDSLNIVKFRDTSGEISVYQFWADAHQGEHWLSEDWSESWIVIK
jgi:hypothetical protein